MKLPLLSLALLSTTALAGPPIPSIPTMTISGQTSAAIWFFHNHGKRRNDQNFGNFRHVPGGPTDPVIRPKEVSCQGRSYRSKFPVHLSVNTTRLKFSLDGKTEQGMDYGAVIVFNGDPNSEHLIRESYLSAGGSWGHVYIGDTYGVESTMSFGGFDAMGATGGFDSTAVEKTLFITTGAPHSVNLTGSTKRATKLSYLTPRYRGFQAGISYTPRQDHRGSAPVNSSVSASFPKKPFDSNGIAGGLNYLHTFNEHFNIALSGTAIFAKSNPACKSASWSVRNNAGTVVASGSNAPHNTKSYAFGTLMNYGNWGFGLEYGHNGDSQQLKSPVGGVNLSNGWFVDTGVSYTWGSLKAAAGYYYGRRTAAQLLANDTFKKVRAYTNIYSFTLDQKLAPGLGIFGELNYYQARNPGATVDTMLANSMRSPSENRGPILSNSMYAIAIGTKLKF